jgi:hypothetical protein
MAQQDDAEQTKSDNQDQGVEQQSTETAPGNVEKKRESADDETSPTQSGNKKADIDSARGLDRKAGLRRSEVPEEVAPLKKRRKDSQNVSAEINSEPSNTQAGAEKHFEAKLATSGTGVRTQLFSLSGNAILNAELRGTCLCHRCVTLCCL